MRVWDVAAGYVNRQSLLGEHRELHALHVVVADGRTGYANHPETRRWVEALSGLARRHAHLAAEMRLRGYVDRSPLDLRGSATWPAVFVTDPFDQLLLLRQKYTKVEQGRIPLPRNPQELWAQHKYSVMARDPDTYRRLGRAVSRMRRPDAMRELARTLVLTLREPPAGGRLLNAIEHMWDHVSDRASADERRAAGGGPLALLSVVQTLAMRHREPFLMSSTALSELAAGAGSEPDRLLTVS